MNKRTIITLLVTAFVCLSQSTWAGRLKGQAVTWADFNYVNQITASISHVYFATAGGIIRFNKLESRWEYPMTGADGLENENLRRIWVGRFDDDLFVETGMGLYEYDRLFDRWYPLVELPDIDSDCTHIPPPQDLLPGDGISLIGDDRISDMHYRTYAITDVLDDNSGDLWIGTWGYGAGIAGSSARLMTLLPYGLLQNRVDALCHNDNLLWISGAIGSSSRTGLTASHEENNEFV